MACWNTKAAISLKRVKIGEKLLWRAYLGTHQRSFEQCPAPPPFPKIGGSGFATQRKTAITIISRTGKATNFKFGRYTFTAPFEQRPREKRERGRIQGLPKFFEYPLLAQERVKLTSNLAGAFTRSIRKFGMDHVNVPCECTFQ